MSPDMHRRAKVLVESFDMVQAEFEAARQEAFDEGFAEPADKDYHAHDDALAGIAVDAIELLRMLAVAPHDFTCTECGDSRHSTYVVTTLDRSNPRETRTEVCLTCHEALHSRKEA